MQVACACVGCAPSPRMGQGMSRWYAPISVSPQQCAAPTQFLPQSESAEEEAARQWVRAYARLRLRELSLRSRTHAHAGLEGQLRVSDDGAQRGALCFNAGVVLIATAEWTRLRLASQLHALSMSRRVNQSVLQHHVAAAAAPVAATSSSANRSQADRSALPMPGGLPTTFEWHQDSIEAMEIRDETVGI